MQNGSTAWKPLRLSHDPTKTPGAPVKTGKGTVESAAVTAKLS
jgi:hypothetical protein